MAQVIIVHFSATLDVIFLGTFALLIFGGSPIEALIIVPI